MRAFQLKTQRNITIVDLDDDNDEADKDKENDKDIEKAKTKEAGDAEAASTADDKPQDSKTSDEAEPMSVDTTTDDAAKKDAKKTTNEATSSQPDKADDVEMNEANKSSTETTNDKSKDDSIKKNEEELTNTNLKLQEPTLFELLNWLDNPPEDITFVSEFCITLEDFCEAVKVVQPSAKREGFITVPDVTWDDVGSLQDIREELKLAVLAPVKFPEKLARLGLSAPSGVLLCGPPGCGKTLLAKAIANEAGINFISVKGPELMNMVMFFS